MEKRSHSGVSVAIYGDGAREHVFAWAANKSAHCCSIDVYPSNAGIAQLPKVLPTASSEQNFLHRLKDQGSILLIGPEDPLAEGLTDKARALGIRVWSPTRRAAQIESSKAFGVEFNEKCGIPQPPFEIFSDPNQARKFIRHNYAASRPVWPTIALKGDTLAKGKGVIVVDNEEEALRAVDDFMVRGLYEGSGKVTLVAQRGLVGPELSVIALADGVTSVCLEKVAQDHKRAFDGDKGPNTGGMGAYAPTRAIPAELLQEINQQFHQKAVSGLAREGQPFTGFLFGGFIFTEIGPQLIEWNARFGDPEAQAIIPLLETDFVSIIRAGLDQRLADLSIRYRLGVSAAVILAGSGYPQATDIDQEIHGLASITDADINIFHTRTYKKDGKIFGQGGRRLTVQAYHQPLDSYEQTTRAALAKIYDHIGNKRVHFAGMHFRRDIGWQVVGR